MSKPKPADARTLMVLGLLQAGPKHGYELHRILAAHGDLAADFKKPTLYHLLHRLTLQGAVAVHTEPGTRGRRGERLVFALTPEGATRFQQLLRNALGSFEPSQTSFEMAAAYLPWLPGPEALALLAERRRAILALHGTVVEDMDHLAAEPDSQRLAARSLAMDHTLCLLEAELAWLDRATSHLSSALGTRTALPRERPPARREPVDPIHPDR